MLKIYSDTYARSAAGQAAAPDIALTLIQVGYPARDLELVRSRLGSIKLAAFDVGRVVIWEKDTAGDVYIVHKGGLEVLQRDKEGDEKKIAEVGPGHLVGEMSFLTGRDRSATVKAMAATELFVIPGALFESMLVASPVFKAEMLALAEKRRLALEKP